MGLYREEFLLDYQCLLPNDSYRENVRFRDPPGCRSEAPKASRSMKLWQLGEIRFETQTCHSRVC